MNRGYIQSWNFFVQREFSPTLTAEAGYVGTHAVHQMMAVNINGSAPNTGNAGRQFAPYLTTDLNQYQPFGDLTYNALQTNVKKRIGSSIVGVAYTFSRAIDNYNGDNGDGTHIPRLPGVVRPEQAVGRLRPQTHVPALSRLPVAVRQRAQAAQPRRGGVDRRRIPDWRHPQPVQRPAIHHRLQQFGECRRPGADGVADQSGGPDYWAATTPTPRISTGPPSPIPAVGTLGTTGRDLLRGPGFFNIDENISRTFTFKSEKIKLQFVGEAFNLTNTPSFSTPNATFAAPTLNTDGSVKSYGNYSVISSTVSSARQLQVGAYLRF